MEDLQKAAARDTSVVCFHQTALMYSMMMFRALSSVVLVCVCGVCVCVSAERQELPRDFGVKLCGREFIRAVIFTCGGSRWRRDSPWSVDGGVPFLWSLRLDTMTSDRRKRNFSLGLAGMCCNQGCTKNDIGRLC
ncbi:prorelaxin H1 [Rhinichthys klamathensis goyatoka]|uniref:prorelaxin H1 n=1 Tax=Rhinichthys klamathensis goyatoka TaxID=3034132 RepID=UPI0024B4BF85|nr:prorelaxin H1 [Rhinichthys klamathensis goyatoka]